jgi:hypothetical protein
MGGDLGVRIARMSRDSLNGQGVRIVTKDLKELVERARKVTMTAEQVREQRQSFVYGNTNIENERITRELVASVDREIEEKAS